MQKTDRTIWKQKAEKIAREYAARKSVKAPKISVSSKSPDAQACATFNEIELHQGLLDCVATGEISEASLQAAIAHEMGHILHRDLCKIVGWKLVKLLPFPFSLPFHQCAKQYFYTSEFAADQTAVELTDAETLITALRELEVARRRLVAEDKIESCRSRFDYEHPTTEERIEAIRTT